METIKYNLDDINTGVINDLSTEQKKNTDILNSIDSLYLGTCSESPIGRMKNNIKTSINKLLTGYKNIIDWTTNYTTACQELETSLIDEINSDLSDEMIDRLQAFDLIGSEDNYDWMFTDPERLEQYLSGTPGIAGYEVITDAKGHKKIVISLTNGHSYVVYRQSTYGDIYIGGSSLARGGCAVFAFASCVSYLTNNPDLAIEDIVKSMGSMGTWGSFGRVLLGQKPLYIDGVKYKIDADVSQSSRGSGSERVINYSPSEFTKEEYIAEMTRVLTNDGVIINLVGGLNISKISGSEKKAAAKDITERTYITSKGGHFIAMVGLTPEGKIIFADSVYRQDGTTGFNKDITLEEYYDYYLSLPTGDRGEDHRDVWESFTTVENFQLTPWSD